MSHAFAGFTSKVCIFTSNRPLSKIERKTIGISFAYKTGYGTVQLELRGNPRLAFLQ